MEEENKEASVEPKVTSAEPKGTPLKFIQEKKGIFIAAIVVVLLLVIVGIGLSSMTTKAQGNTVGNLRNYGFVAEGGSWVYYLKFDGYSTPEGIYKVQKNGDKKEKVTSEYGVYINVDGGYLYFADEDENLVKMKTNGKNKETLVKSIDELPITVADGWIYYSKNYNFYRVKTNGKDSEKITNKEVESYQIVGGWIYYTYYNSGDYALAKMKLDGSESEKIDGDVTTAFYVKGNTIYFICEEYSSKNYTYSYDLYSMKTNGKNRQHVTEFEEELYDIEYVNMNDDGIYYLAENDDGDYAIFFMDYKGKKSKEITVIDTYSTPICVIDKWVYYTDYDDDYDMYTYRVKIDGKSKKEL